jgi:hypothetical protein
MCFGLQLLLTEVCLPVRIKNKTPNSPRLKKLPNSKSETVLNAECFVFPCDTNLLYYNSQKNFYIVYPVTHYEVKNSRKTNKDTIL